MSIGERFSRIRPRRAVLVSMLALALLLGSVFIARPFLFGPEVKVHAAARSSLVQTVVATGRVETPLRVEIGSQVTGAITAIPVAEGQTVKAGQVLIELEDDEARAAVEQARAAVRQAHARMMQVNQVGLPVAEQAVRQAEANLVNARRQYARSKDLFASGFVGQVALDDAQRHLDVAESQAASARAQLLGMEKDGSEALTARASLEQAEATLRMAEARLRHTTIAAPVDGVLIARSAERGDVIQPGKVLMVLSPFGRTQLVVDIDEKNLRLLRVGQQALASADAYPAERFEARLVYLNPAVDPQRGSVEAKFDVSRPPSYLRQDMTVSVDIAVATRPDALVVPTEALHDSAGQSWVLKVVGRRARRQPVTTGATGAGSTEILGGLQPGDLVVLGTGALADGSRVRPSESGRGTRREGR